MSLLLNNYCTDVLLHHFTYLKWGDILGGAPHSTAEARDWSIDSGFSRDMRISFWLYHIKPHILSIPFLPSLFCTVSNILKTMIIWQVFHHLRHPALANKLVEHQGQNRPSRWLHMSCFATGILRLCLDTTKIPELVMFECPCTIMNLGVLNLSGAFFGDPNSHKEISKHPNTRLLCRSSPIPIWATTNALHAVGTKNLHQNETRIRRVLRADLF